MKIHLRLVAILLVCLCLNIAVAPVSVAGLVGDADGDGYVTFYDARKVLRYAAGMDKPTKAQTELCDMNQDGKLTIADVKAIMSNALDLESYTEELVRKGFPVSYAEYLTELHKKHPEWEFVPMITGLDWETAVGKEREPHSQQLIENSVTSSFMCSCKSCKGVIQEASNWVSASETAVKYYMDPRNFLTEEYIFQFESTAYDKTHTKEGVEVILKNTWMYNADITYIDALGTEKTYKENGKTVKYSDAILKAAKESGMSAYYLASKIVQEVGSSSASGAGGSSGKNSPYNGIYNYYNIGAYTGVRDGLQWANGFMKASKSTTLYKSASASSSKTVTVPSGTELYYISTSGDFYRVSVSVGSKTYSGYINKSDTSVYTSYGRPWTTPYKTIYYGAQYIFDSFGDTQYTGYLQKFNVNPQSENIYNHEYMANVRAAAAESKKTYQAYVSAGILETEKVFSIPVFENMPGADMTSEDYFKTQKPTVTASGCTADSVTLSWNEISGAEAYRVYKYNEQTQKYERVSSSADTSYTDSSLSKGVTAKYKVRGYYKNANDEFVFTEYSAAFEATVKPDTVSGLKVSSVGDTSVKIKWNTVDCTGYQVYRYDVSSGSYKKIATLTSASYTDTGLDSATAYRYKVRAYNKTASANFSGSYSATVSATTTGVATGYVKITDGLLYIRKSPSTDADILAKLENGYKVTVSGTSGDWYKVSFTLDGDKLTGYAYKDYINVSGGNTAKTDCPYSEPTVTLAQGNSGESVKWLQWYLWKVGYLTEGDIDGAFGAKTLSAVKAFQADSKLDVDGYAGSATRTALKKAYGA